MAAASPIPRSAGPFDPDGVAWTGVSPRLADARRTMLAISLGVVALAVTLIGVLTLPWWAWLLADVVLAVLFLTGWGVTGRSARAIGYAEREDDLLVRHGVMFRTLVVVPYGRMQYVDVQAGPLDRAFGIAQVQLHTASAATDASIPGLSPEEAARLRDRLASRGQARLAGL
jgi:membrane protein YdbS with pleckstrin-like domain